MMSSPGNALRRIPSPSRRHTDTRALATDFRAVRAGGHVTRAHRGRAGAWPAVGEGSRRAPWRETLRSRARALARVAPFQSAYPGREHRAHGDGRGGDSRFSPDVAFIDIGLPGIDGHEVGRRLRARLPSNVVLIAMSGYGQAEDRARSLAAGFDDHLVKPVPAARMEQVLTEIALARG